MAKLIKVYVVSYNTGDSSGVGEDGIHHARFARRRDAEAFAVGKVGMYGGGPATVDEDEVSRALAQRWGVV